MRYEALRASLKASRAKQVETIAEREARPVILNPTSVPDFAVPRSMTPKVSIIIPVYNEFRVTLECLKSIAQGRLETPIEVIVGDDCSTDPAIRKLANSRPDLRAPQEESQLSAKL